MKFRLHNRKYNDELIVEAENIEEIKEIAKHETNKRGWQEEDMWSEEIKEG